jgi:hypothetical protein
MGAVSDRNAQQADRRGRGADLDEPIAIPTARPMRRETR